MLLSHLTFFPYRQGRIPFSAMGDPSPHAMSISGYQFNRQRKLVPVPEALLGASSAKPIRFNIRDKEGTLLEFFNTSHGKTVALSGSMGRCRLKESCRYS
jgi:hypothetical protein